MRRLFLSLASLALASVLHSAPSPASAATEWNLASRLAEGVFHTVNLRYFAEDVEEATNGELKITVHSAASLFRHPEIKRAVQTGQIEMGTLQISSFANEDELFNFDGIPFLATTYYENALLWEAAKPIFEERMMRDNIRVLWAEPWPPQAFYAKKKIQEVTDFKGVKFRTYNRIGSRTAELMGAQPVLIMASEVTQALATGMADAMVTSSAFGASVQAWDYIKYFHDVGAWFGYDETIVNEDAFQNLKPELQQVLLEAAHRAEVRGWVMSFEANEMEKARLVENGMEIVTPSKEFMDELREVTKVQTQEWMDQVGEKAKIIIDRYNALKARK